jgi:hypothetical protein
MLKQFAVKRRYRIPVAKIRNAERKEDDLPWGRKVIRMEGPRKMIKMELVNHKKAFIFSRIIFSPRNERSSRRFEESGFMSSWVSMDRITRNEIIIARKPEGLSTFLLFFKEGFFFVDILRKNLQPACRQTWLQVTRYKLQVVKIIFIKITC